MYLSPPVPAPTPNPPDSSPRETSRLAPSPTGALHLGNARTFLTNWALARQRSWRLILRIEDLDTPRVKPDAADSITHTLRWLGIDWDPAPSPTPVLVQSHDLEPYRAAMRSLAARALVYPCALSRTDIEAAASAPQEGSHETPFPPHLRPPLRPLDFDQIEADAGPDGSNWRFAIPPGPVSFTDAFAGPRTFDISSLVGDFVVWTKRRQPSYQLAVVVDDHRQHVTQVVRADDLLDSAARQILLYRALGYTSSSGGADRHHAAIPTYTHLPLVLGTDGKRLAKRHGDTRVDSYRRLAIPRDAIIGLVFHWSLPPDRRPASPSPLPPDQFIRRLDLSTMSRNPVIFTREDDRWLRSHAPHA